MFEVKKRVYRFGGKTAEGDGTMRELLGGKGANLAEMSKLGMPVPAGFTITTECCAEYYQLGGGYTEELKMEVRGALNATEALMGKKFGDPNDPLLVSCRSGARSSMPGMMDTILNIGLCSATIPGMIKKTGNPRFVYDAYRRLIMMYSDVVMEKAEGIEPADGQGIRQQLDRMMAELKEKKGYASDTDITADELKDLCIRHLYEMAGDIIMALLLLGDASKDADLFAKSAKVYTRYAAAEVEKHYDFVMSCTEADLDDYRK